MSRFDPRAVAEAMDGGGSSVATVTFARGTPAGTKREILYLFGAWGTRKSRPVLLNGEGPLLIDAAHSARHLVCYPCDGSGQQTGDAITLAPGRIRTIEVLA